MSERHSQFPNLFSEIRIDNCVVANRIVSTGHHTYLSDQVPDEKLVAYHEARAKGGAGLIITEIVATHATAGFSSNLLQIRDRDAVPAYRALTQACHQHGAKMFAQLFHPGREILSSPCGMLPIAWAPSAVANERFHIMPKPMSVALIEEIIESHGTAAMLLSEAGFDGVEIVANHGYLPAQFLNPKTNLRDDDYGGDEKRRSEFLRRLIDAIKKAAPELVIGLRISGSEMDELGLTAEQVQGICKLFAADLDYFSIVAGTSSSLGASVHIVPPMGIEQGYIAQESAKIRSATGKPVIVTGRINQPQIAEQILVKGQADLCGMTRAMICDHAMPAKAKQGRLEQIRSCIGCNQSCIGRAHKGLGISCIQHPESGRETLFRAPVIATQKKRIMVIGGGPAGMKAAAIAAARGHKVSLHEQQPRLGGQVQLAMQLPGRVDFGGMTDNLHREMIDSGVDIFTRSAASIDDILRARPDYVIAATGALPLVPDLEGMKQDSVATAWRVIQEQVSLGRRVVIADWRADWIGLGLAERLARDGHIVSLFTNAAMAGETLQTYTRNHYVGRVKKLGVEICTHARLYGCDDDTVYFQDTLTMEPMVIESIDNLVLSLGHTANNTLEQALDESGIAYQAVGDCVVPRTAEEAIYDALKLAWAI